jgi:hypothetical protein
MGYVSKSKDPDAVLDYTWPWAAEGWLVDDIISAATFTVYAADGSEIPDSDTTPVKVDSDSFTDTDATAWLSGGTLGLTYLCVCHITTSGGREDDRTLKLTIKQK